MAIAVGDALAMAVALVAATVLALAAGVEARRRVAELGRRGA